MNQEYKITLHKRFTNQENEREKDREIFQGRPSEMLAVTQEKNWGKPEYMPSAPRSFYRGNFKTEDYSSILVDIFRGLTHNFECHAFPIPILILHHCVGAIQNQHRI